MAFSKSIGRLCPEKCPETAREEPSTKFIIKVVVPPHRLLFGAENDADRDYWLSADDAKEYGLIDNVLEMQRGFATNGQAPGDGEASQSGAGNEARATGDLMPRPPVSFRHRPGGRGRVA